ncbi:helix-turn-helix domain-containing protein [Bacillus sp. FJAT-27251]|uniref:winged helix-turn-helix transcriptional regulator n=1 Tax=Bacillus sp. FJAT-27251 TaxID=1684142 RepID=UPI0009E298FD|nr:helix-turn-helix domain-containing protein [Bacillus sp. FJAT-27251]
MKKNDTDCNHHSQELKGICLDFHGTIEFIGKRWMGIIIYQLLNGPKRFSELAENIPGISDRLLTERLRELEKEGLVIKNALFSSQKIVHYELTPAGKELETVISSILTWIRIKQKRSN